MTNPIRQPLPCVPLGRRAAVFAAACLLLGGAASGCNPKPKTSGQVAAQVNGTEITVHELNRRLLEVEVKAQELAPSVKREILDELIDRELLVQRALNDKLDRDPEIMRAIEDARAGILAEAVIKRELGAQPEPDPARVQAFVNAHPELFGRRRVYSLEQFTVSAGSLGKELMSRLDGVHNPRDIDHVLKEAKVPYEAETLSRGAEQLPMELAGKLLSVARGDVVTFADGNSVHIVFIQDFQEAPIDEELAQANTKEYLGNVDQQEILANTLKRLRATAEIKYLGEFQAAAVNGVSEAKPQSPFQPAGTPGGEQEGGEKKNLPGHVQRGLSGLVK